MKEMGWMSFNDVEKEKLLARQCIDFQGLIVSLCKGCKNLVCPLNNPDDDSNKEVAKKLVKAGVYVLGKRKVRR
jgi:hypothetical protein